MIISSITISHSEETIVGDTFLRQWDKMEVTGLLEEGDTFESSANQLRSRAIETFKKHNPTAQVLNVQVGNQKAADLISSIYAASTPKELETFKPFLEGDQLAKQAYDMMHKKLTTKTV